MVLTPEVIAAAAKSSIVDPSQFLPLLSHVLSLVLRTVQTEGSLELIMTGLQAIKACIENACTKWANIGVDHGIEPLTPASSLSILTTVQMESISECARLVLRDSLQRRAVMRAEAKVSGNGIEEEDLEDEQLFMSSSLELHFNLSELIGILLRTHGQIYMPTYIALWHESIESMAHPNCLKEDRQFAFFIVCDVVEFGVDDANFARKYLPGVIPLLVECCKGPYDASLRQSCCYAIGIAAKRFPTELEDYYSVCLQGLVACVANGEDEEERRGCCTDNAIASIGIIIEAIDKRQCPGFEQQMSAMWTQWLNYLPLQHDKEEGHGVIQQLIRCLSSQYVFFTSSSSIVDRAIVLLVDVISSDLVTTQLNEDIKTFLKTNPSVSDRIKQIINVMPAESVAKLASM
jgi:hypothetical protein